MRTFTTPKPFFLNALLLSFLFTLIIAYINFKIDVFGLFQKSDQEQKIVSYDERFCKYIMAHNYIPSNFNGILIGPSLSANINTEQLDGYNIFNLSLMGANISEEKLLIEKILAHSNDIEIAIVCVNPYLTGNHGVKTLQMSHKALFSSLGSYELMKEYMVRVIRKFNILPNKYPKNEFNAYGYNNYDKLFAVQHVDQCINDEIQKHKNSPIKIDSTAITELATLDSMFAANHITTIYYFHPLPSKIYHSKQKEFDAYASLIKTNIHASYLIDFNEARFDISMDCNNYIDHGHLSKAGQKKLIGYLNEILASNQYSNELQATRR